MASKNTATKAPAISKWGKKRWWYGHICEVTSRFAVQARETTQKRATLNFRIRYIATFLLAQTDKRDRQKSEDGVREKTIVSTGEHIHFLIITQKNHLNDNDLQVWLPGVINWHVMTQCRICKRGIKHHVKVLTISLHKGGKKGREKSGNT